MVDFINAIAVLITALATVFNAWVVYREYHDKKNTAQPPSAQGSARTSVPTVDRRIVLLGACRAYGKLM